MATTHIVSQGECLSSIAAMYGLASWRTLYDHPNNAELRRRRPNPNLIYPGDQVYIPDLATRIEIRPTDRQHRFLIHRTTTHLRIVLKYEDGTTLEGVRYKLELDEVVQEGVIGAGGLVDHEIPAVAESGRLTVWVEEDGDEIGYTWPLEIGHLDPVSEISGIQARLNNLGFSCGRVDGICGPKTKAAVRSFQRYHQLAIDGIPGPQTRRKLEEVHGC